jgi:hypothetical protein
MKPCPESYGHDHDPDRPPCGPTMHIEAVITCVGYADYLAETLPLNKPHFDRVTVATSNEDLETLELCRRLSVPCYATGKFRREGEPFNKARGINHALKYLRYQDWVCHLDADTVLCRSAGHWMRRKRLEPSKIYGCDRLNCVGWDAWQRWKHENHSGHDFNCRVHFPRLPVLDRIALEDDGGYAPIGFMQLWNVKSGRLYPVHDGTYATAERTDVAHATQWDEHDRILLGEIYALHLQAREEPLGANWKGRVTPRFGPGR